MGGGKPFGMWKSSPSATSVMPTSSRKLSASILIVGLWSTNREMRPENTIMIAIAMTTAATMTLTLSTMPTAVITESSENTRSSRKI